MGSTNEVVFPKIILFGDSITQVSAPIFSKWSSFHLVLRYFAFRMYPYIDSILFTSTPIFSTALVMKDAGGPS